MQPTPWAYVLALLVLLSGSAGRAAEPGTVIVVLDGSGSMWGKPDGEPRTKLVLARDGLRAALGKLPPEFRVGLVSYGHRRGGDCSDIETIVKPEAGTFERISGVLEKHNPRGRGPITAALREAAKDLGPASAPATVILVHDDPDNCQADPCTALGDLRRAHPKVTVHVVSLAMRREDSQQMQCLARATNGSLHEVASMQQATQAFEAIARQAATAGRPEEPRSSGKQPPAADPAAALKTQPGKPGLKLVAVLAAGGDPIGSTMRWRVLAAGKPNQAPVFEGDATAPILELPAGRYDVEVQHGFVLARTSVDVNPREARAVTIPLGAGLLQLSSTASRSTLPERAVVTFSRAETAPTLENVAMMRGVPHEVALTPGTYAVTIAIGPTRIERSVTIALGQRLALAPLLDLGEIELIPVAGQNGPPLETTVVTVFEDDPDAAQGRREIARSAAVRPTFALGAGTYTVVARSGTAEARERIVVKAGEREIRTLVLAAARVAVAARLPGRLDGELPAIRLVRLDDARELLPSSRTQTTFDVPAGRYRIEVRFGQSNVRVDRELDLKAGAREQVSIEPPAGAVQVRLLDRARGGPQQDVGWEIRDQGGRTVWIGQQPEARTLLMQGRYTVRADIRGREAVREIEVRAGESRAYDLSLPQ